MDTKSLGKYEIVEELGRGGMGVVYKGWEETLRRHVAIKMLAEQLIDDKNLVARFLREARAVADLNHPNVVQVFAVDTFEGRPYFVMEYVEGDSFSRLIRTERQLDPARAARLVKEAATGLGAAHAKGVVHRDVKPDNIMLTKHGGVKLVDFGIARVEDPNTRLTVSGVAMGTPRYISPEVCLGEEVDHQSDIFSLGIVFYEMLAGETPFQADSPLEMMTKVARSEVPDITALNPKVDMQTRLVLAHMLAKDRAQRYASCTELVADLDACLAGKPPAHASDAAAGLHIAPAARGASDDATLLRATTLETPRAAQEGRQHSGPQFGLAAVMLLAVGAAGAAAWWYTTERDVSAPALADADGAGINGTDATGDDDPGRPDAEPALDPAPLVTDAGASTLVPVDADALDALPAAVEQAVTDADTPDGNAADAALDDTLTVQPDAAPVGENEATLLARVNSPPAVLPAAAAVTVTPRDWRVAPKFVVVVSGDPAVSGAVEGVLEGALATADYVVMDEQLLDGYAAATGLASLGRTMQDGGADILIYADIVSAGERDLNFYGRTERQSVANLEVRALLLGERRNLGVPWQQSLNYVPLNAAEQAQSAAEPIAQELLGRLQEMGVTAH